MSYCAKSNCRDHDHYARDWLRSLKVQKPEQYRVLLDRQIARRASKKGRSPASIAWYHDKGLAAKWFKACGVTAADVDAMIIEQAGLCAICHLPLTKPKLDHDHVTNKPRGILCHRCNIGLGMFDDSAVLLSKAVAYLEAA